MADINKGSGPNTPGSEPSMQGRLLLAFLLMGAILFLTPYFYKTVVPGAVSPKPGETAAETAKLAPTQAPTSEATPAAAVEPVAKPAAKPAKSAQAAAVPVSASKQETVVVDTKVYRLVFSNQGAVVRSWVLKKYKDSEGKPLELVNAAGAEKTGYPFSLAFPDPKARPSVDVNQVLYAVHRDGLNLEFDYSDGNLTVRKTFQFQPDSYLSQVSSDVTQDGKGLPNLMEWRGGFGDLAVQKHASQQRTLFYDVASGKLVTKEAKAAKEGPVSDSGVYSFAGIEDHYFASVFLPQGNGSIEVRTVSDTVPDPAEKTDEPAAGAEIGGTAHNQFSLFVGPKDVALLRKVDPRLEQLVDFGRWFGWLAKPLFLAVNWVNNHMTHNYGWAIVVVTVLINMLILPLRLSSMKSMKRMQELKPQVDIINAKYKNVKLRDPRKADQNAEVMELYKKHGVNPMGGCLPMILQFPIFIAFYSVLSVAIEMRGASWLWVTDLSQPEHLPIRILPVAMVIAQFVMQKMTPNPSADPNQQKMMLFMPLIFGFMFYAASSGLVLYWLTSNLVGIVQQWFINRSMPALTPAPAQVPAPAPEPVARARKKSGSRR
jgi:YidC/Oxa1 family membrane protein insertase